MDDTGLAVWSMGSPIGKIPITEEDFPAHLAKLCHVLELADGRVVPSGHGIGHVKEILDDFRAMGGLDVTVEPHLSVFDGLKDLEQAGQRTRVEAYSYPSSDAAFDAACDALKKLL